MAASRAFLAVCAIVRNEAEYIDEWLTYHRAIGVERFFIYNNNSTDRTSEIIENSECFGSVRLMHWPPIPGQLAAYSHTLDSFRNKAEWCAFIDCDEFLCPQSDLSVAQVLAGLDDSCGGLYAHWLMFGSSGQVNRRPGRVTGRFVRRGYNDFGPNCFGKTIIRMRHATGVLNPHIVQCKGRMLNDSGVEIDQARYGHHSAPSHRLLALNHYFTKSLEEWHRRRSLGKADKQAGDPEFIRSEEEFWQHDVNDVIDMRAARIMQLADSAGARGS